MKGLRYSLVRGLRRRQFRELVVLVLSVGAFFGSLLWGFFEGGWEPWVVAALALAGILSNYSGFLKLVSTRDRLSPEERVAARERMRPRFQQYFWECAKKNYQGDAIIRDIDRIDEYPEINEEAKGISSWFRIGFLAANDDSILVGLKLTYVTVGEKGLVESVSGKEEGATKAYLIGEIPYESIESVNFDGDDYYNKPIIFCHFEYEGGPYRRLFYGAESRLFDDAPWHYSELGEYKRA